jgi:hypothetical protein
MAKFDESDELYYNVNAIAKRNHLIWDGHYGSPYDIDEVIAPANRPKRSPGDSLPNEFRHLNYLFDHTKRFKPRGSGRRSPVMAITEPYVVDGDELRRDVQEFAATFGLAARVNDPDYGIYRADGTIPIVFWRPDLHLLQ